MANPEEVSIVKYRSLDGELYDDEAKAKMADACWREENEWEMDKEIKYLSTRRIRYFDKHVDHFNSNNFSVYPILVMDKGKHGDAYYIAMDRDGFLDAFWKIFEERMGEYGWYSYLEGKWAEISKHILETKNREAAHGMIMERSFCGHEYETIDIQYGVPSFGNLND